MKITVYSLRMYVGSVQFYVVSWIQCKMYTCFRALVQMEAQQKYHSSHLFKSELLYSTSISTCATSFGVL